jgi:hypothetical protein
MPEPATFLNASLSQPPPEVRKEPTLTTTPAAAGQLVYPWGGGGARWQQALESSLRGSFEPPAHSVVSRFLASRLCAALSTHQAVGDRDAADLQWGDLAEGQGVQVELAGLALAAFVVQEKCAGGHVCAHLRPQ